jgi:hypothetical protein
MAELLLNFEQEINISAQVGDIAYYLDETILDPLVEDSFSTQSSSIAIAGPIIYISPDRKTMGLEVHGNFSDVVNVNSKYYMFSKDNAVNLASPLGYFAKLKIVNNSQVKSEMFAISCEVFESSK